MLEAVVTICVENGEERFQVSLTKNGTIVCERFLERTWKRKEVALLYALLLQDEIDARVEV